MQVGEVAAPASGDTDFFGKPGGMIDQDDLTAALAGDTRAHHACCAGTDDRDIKMISHGLAGFGEAVIVNVGLPAPHPESEKKKTAALSHSRQTLGNRSVDQNLMRRQSQASS